MSITVVEQTVIVLKCVSVYKKIVRPKVYISLCTQKVLGLKCVPNVLRQKVLGLKFLKIFSLCTGAESIRPEVCLSMYTCRKC